jgi:hypothetical protein
VRLDLSHNDITEPGAELLADALQFNSSVTTLILNGCKIGSKGGIYVASMLQASAYMYMYMYVTAHKVLKFWMGVCFFALVRLIKVSLVLDLLTRTSIPTASLPWQLFSMETGH